MSAVQCFVHGEPRFHTYIHKCMCCSILLFLLFSPCCFLVGVPTLKPNSLEHQHCKTCHPQPPLILQHRKAREWQNTSWLGLTGDPQAKLLNCMHTASFVAAWSLAALLSSLQPKTSPFYCLAWRVAYECMSQKGFSNFPHVCTLTFCCAWHVLQISDFNAFSHAPLLSLGSSQGLHHSLSSLHCTPMKCNFECGYAAEQRPCTPFCNPLKHPSRQASLGYHPLQWIQPTPPQRLILGRQETLRPFPQQPKRRPLQL